MSSRVYKRSAVFYCWQIHSLLSSSLLSVVFSQNGSSFLLHSCKFDISILLLLTVFVVVVFNLFIDYFSSCTCWWLWCRWPTPLRWLSVVMMAMRWTPKIEVGALVCGNGIVANELVAQKEIISISPLCPNALAHSTAHGWTCSFHFSRFLID